MSGVASGGQTLGDKGTDPPLSGMASRGQTLHCHFERSEAESRNLVTSPSVISSEESEANEVEKSQPLSSPDDGDLSAPVSDDTSGRDDMLEDKKTSMTADEWFAETESEPEEQESFRDKMRRWFS